MVRKCGAATSGCCRKRSAIQPASHSAVGPLAAIDEAVLAGHRVGAARRRRGSAPGGRAASAPARTAPAARSPAAILRQQLSRHGVAALAPIPAHLVVDQAGIALQLRRDHAQPARERCRSSWRSAMRASPSAPVSGSETRQQPLRRRNAPGPQQPIEPLRVIGVGQHVAKRDVEVLFLLDRLRIGARPGGARHLRRPGHPRPT